MLGCPEEERENEDQREDQRKRGRKKLSQHGVVSGPVVCWFPIDARRKLLTVEVEGEEKEEGGLERFFVSRASTAEG